LIGSSQKKILKLSRLHNIEIFSPKHRSMVKAPILAPLILGFQEDNIEETIEDKSEVLLRTSWGTHWKLEKTS